MATTFNIGIVEGNHLTQLVNLIGPKNRRGFAYALQIQTLASKSHLALEHALLQVHHKLTLGLQKKALGLQTQSPGHFCGTLNDVA